MANIFSIFIANKLVMFQGINAIEFSSHFKDNDHDIHMIRVVKGCCRAIKGRIIEVPFREKQFSK